MTDSVMPKFSMTQSAPIVNPRTENTRRSMTGDSMSSWRLA